MKDEIKYANLVAAVQAARSGKQPRIMVHPNSERGFIEWLRQYCDPTSPNCVPIFMGVGIHINSAVEPGQVTIVDDWPNCSYITAIKVLEKQP